MSKKSRYDGLEATVGMAVVDLIPCILFAVSAVCLSIAVKQPLFIIGQMICALAGFGKAIWKFIMAIQKKNVDWLASQFKYSMSAGFLFCIVSLVVGHKTLSVSIIFKNLFSFPVVIFIIAGMVLMIAMIVLGVKMDPADAKANWREERINILAQFLFMIAAVIIAYSSNHYDAMQMCQLGNETGITESKIKEGMFFDGPGNTEALVFYPGGLVDYEAYAPLMREIASLGVDCFLVEMPYHLAVFGANKADRLVDSTNYSYEQWFIGGHSLGGAMAAAYASDNADKISGLLLCAAYSTKKLDDELVVVSVYGTEDKVLNMKSYEMNKSNFPAEYAEEILEGGNHGHFGDYGEQKGDGVATISREEQLRETARAFVGCVLKQHR